MIKNYSINRTDQRAKQGFSEKTHQIPKPFQVLRVGEMSYVSGIHSATGNREKKPTTSP